MGNTEPCRSHYTGALYHNYKGLFFHCHVRSGRWRVQFQMSGHGHSWFNSHLKAKIEDGPIGFPNLCPIHRVIYGPYFILSDDAFALKTWLMKPYGRRMLTIEERIVNYSISMGKRVVENAFGIQRPVDNYGAAPRNSERNSIDLCSASQHTKKSLQWYA